LPINVPGPRGKHHSAVFLHQPAYLIEGPAILARHYGFAVFYGAMHPAGKGCYEFRLTPVCGDASWRRTNLFPSNMLHYWKKDIQRNPPLWLWSHKRWKRRPDKKILIA
jgi:KDO2-lipid IV(A) lauroyltransferase